MKLSDAPVRAPKSEVARLADEILLDRAPAFLRNHSHRTYVWAAGLALQDGVRYDADVLYVASLLHDIGLLPHYDTGACFERDSADAAARLARNGGWDDGRATAVSDAIAAHMNPADGIPEEPEGRLLWHATGTDVSGHRLTDLPEKFIASTLAEWPRAGFKRGFSDLFEDQTRRKPKCRLAVMVESGLLLRIADAPFES